MEKLAGCRSHGGGGRRGVAGGSEEGASIVARPSNIIAPASPGFRPEVEIGFDLLRE